MLGRITKAHWLLHFIVFIWGWSPIIGRAIESQALQLVWFRMSITILALFLFFILKRENLSTSPKKITTLFTIGGIIAFHWFCFYHAIKVSNVSVTLVGFSTGTIFTALIEPLFYKRKLILYELFFGLIIIGAITLIMLQDFNSQTTKTLNNEKSISFSLGIFYGTLAAFTSSLFTVFNGILVRNTSSSIITCYELSGGLIFISIYILFTGGFNGVNNFFVISGWDYFYLTILAVVGTAFPFIASTNLLKKISPYTMTLTVNLETVYGIILAAIIFKEHQQLTPLFYISTGIILSVILLNAMLKNFLSKRNPQKN
jgi:drug/metabolite transporter (DMT)-like permease